MVFVAIVGGLSGCATLTSPQAVHKTPTSALSARSLQERLFYHVLVGDIAGDRGDLSAAAKAFGQAASESGDLRLTQRSVLLALYARDYGEADTLARRWVRQKPDSIQGQEALADAALGLHNLSRAQAGFLKALHLVGRREGPGGQAFAFERIAALLLRHKPHVGALRVMQALSAHYTADPVASYALADLARTRGRYGLATQAIDRALAEKPHWEDAAVLKARILWTHTPLLALAFSKQFLLDNPGATRLRLDYARRLVSLQYWHHALKQFEIIEVAVPNDPQVLYATGLLALQTQQPQLAARNLRRALKLVPTDAHIRLYLGEIAEKAGHYRKATRWYKTVGAPYRFAARLRLALLPLWQGHPHQASIRLEKMRAHSVGRQTTLALAYNQVYVKLHNYRAALVRLNRVMIKAPHKSALLYARALDEEKLGQVRQAEVDLQSLVATHPYDPVVLNALGYTLVNHKQHVQHGLALIVRALQLDPQNPYIMDSVGWAYFQLGHKQRALPYLQKAFALTHNATIAVHLGTVLWAIGHLRQAKKVWLGAHLKHPRSAVLNRTIRAHAL